MQAAALLACLLLGLSSAIRPGGDIVDAREASALLESSRTLVQEVASQETRADTAEEIQEEAAKLASGSPEDADKPTGLKELNEKSTGFETVLSGPQEGVQNNMQAAETAYTDAKTAAEAWLQKSNEVVDQQKQFIQDVKSGQQTLVKNHNQVKAAVSNNGEAGDGVKSALGMASALLESSRTLVQEVASSPEGGDKPTGLKELNEKSTEFENLLSGPQDGVQNNMQAAEAAYTDAKTAAEAWLKKSNEVVDQQKQFIQDVKSGQQTLVKNHNQVKAAVSNNGEAGDGVKSALGMQTEY